MNLLKFLSGPTGDDWMQRVETLERQMKNIRLEWEETYEKIDRGQKRMNKRARDLAEAETAIPQDGPGTTGALERILARRRMANRG